MRLGIVLAGGRSSRFDTSGRTSKLDADLGGRSVLDRAIEAVAAACDEVVVVGRVGRDERRVRYVPDAEPLQGPLAGLAGGLEAVEGAESAVALGGDMPLARHAVLRLLLDRLARDPAIDAVVLGDRDELRPLPIALRPAEALPAVHVALHERRRSLRSLLDGLRVATIPDAVWRLLDAEGDTLLDVDLPADLELARRRLAGG